jgi:ribulose 1,5-bisphosphate synthetase/thiazole synthase
MLTITISTAIIILIIYFYFEKNLGKFNKKHEYDMIIVGGGIAGSTLAHSMSQIGKKVLVIERDSKDVERIMGEGKTTNKNKCCNQEE